MCKAHSNDKSHIRHIHASLSMWVITVKGNILATSMSVISDEDNDNGLSPLTPSIFVYNIEDLINKNVKSEKLSPLELKCPIEHFSGSDPHITLNSNSLFAITKRSKSPFGSKEGSTIHQWNFWNSKCELCKAMMNC